MCYYCGKVGVPLEADHVIPASVRPDLALDPSNVVAACHACHVAKGEHGG